MMIGPVDAEMIAWPSPRMGIDWPLAAKKEDGIGEKEVK
jgi:hypothetical protein